MVERYNLVTFNHRPHSVRSSKNGVELKNKIKRGPLIFIKYPRNGCGRSLFVKKTKEKRVLTSIEVE